MPVELSFEVDGDVQLARSLSRFGAGVSDMRPAFHDIANLFWNIEKRQFDSEGAYGSGGWGALSPSYDAWKSHYFPGKPILQRTGRMMSSLIGMTSDTVKEINPKNFRIGTSVYYALFHQRGTSKMAARPVIQLTEADKREWVKVVQRWLVNMAKQVGLKLR